MKFNMKYKVSKDYIQKGTRRGGDYFTPNFGVLHDTGNPGSTARNNQKYFNSTPNDPSSASAHTFIDDQTILEIIPLTTGKAEKAFHVRYNRPEDNELFGDDANDKAVGVELCFGGNITFAEAYKRYVWYCAYVSYVFKFDPSRWIGHEKLDPPRRDDPSNALKRYGKTYDQLRKDIINEYYRCLIKDEPYPGHLIKTGSKDVQNIKKIQAKLNVKSDGIFGPITTAAVKTFQKTKKLQVDGIVGPKTWAALFS
ncbi:N-acetylmuramoyl-L-alanine amidase CwlA [Fictibacillus macauensis ZFHKF-1]|uniref:N-acetylmuramoyl-L-alanine amidase n=1 Tax=Fictibacillus macauensis ZFHKF-1 TaxID=1196324 RepID=I8AKQ6_9BACL|nr:N-acetylmuramoyl-L-alanine amidase [Fictibacillus macauensis]EIT86422.1 N-acetylmuramoyl-L-alanine amidase CwlA [Fictibacillus macauensis ZFHKF-1]